MPGSGRGRCASCLPAVDKTSVANAARTHVAPRGTRCDASRGSRLLTEAECMAFGRQHKFIGSQVERAEFPGCILWNDKYVEYNAHADQSRGCNVHGKGGKCICIGT